MNDVPVPRRIEVDGGTVVVLTWEDGTATSFTAAQVRAACPCATCREPAGMEQTRLALNGLAPVTIVESKLVGGYAINFVFGPDAHGTGIFPFADLRRLGELPSEA